LFYSKKNYHNILRYLGDEIQLNIAILIICDGFMTSPWSVLYGSTQSLTAYCCRVMRRK